MRRLSSMASTAGGDKGTVTKPKAPGGKANDLHDAKLKVVVRSLPPNLPEQVFWQSVTPWVHDGTTTWKTFCPGKLRKG